MNRPRCHTSRTAWPYLLRICSKTNAPSRARRSECDQVLDGGFSKMASTPNSSIVEASPSSEREISLKPARGRDVVRGAGSGGDVVDRHESLSSSACSRCPPVSESRCFSLSYHPEMSSAGKMTPATATWYRSESRIAPQAYPVGTG